VYTNGFLFEEKIGLRRIDADAAQAAGIDKSHYRLLQQGKDVESNDGTLVENKKVTFAPHPVMKYAYCSDTAYHPPIIDIIHKADWLYHEATFLNQHNALAAQTKHSTAQQAAEIAKKAEVGRLILGHYSSRYKDLALFVDEAKAVFSQCDFSCRWCCDFLTYFCTFIKWKETLGIFVKTMRQTYLTKHNFPICLLFCSINGLMR
jgi:ribonuclease Z